MTAERKNRIGAAFDAYTAAYDIGDVKIRLKYDHTYRVADNSEKIAASLSLPEGDLLLAWEIGMLHDIGRFEQVRQYGTFLDSLSVNHAEFGADLLFRDGLIARFGIPETNYPLIEKAIRCHNRYLLPEDLSEREGIFCRIIRDADKVDIFRVNVETGMEAIYNVPEEVLKKESVTPAVKTAFLKRHTIDRALMETTIDHLVGHLALAFGLEYKESRRLALQQGYLSRLMAFSSDNPDTAAFLWEAGEILRDFLSA